MVTKHGQHLAQNAKETPGNRNVAPMQNIEDIIRVTNEEALTHAQE